MTIDVIPVRALKDNYIWMIVDVTESRALIVDPGDATPAMEFLEQHQLKPAAILLTHHHWDHTNGVEELQQRYQIPVYGSAAEKISNVTNPLKHDDQFIVRNFPLQLQVIGIPGHTLGHIAFYTKDLLFSGDTLFAAGCGRLFEGTAKQLFTSLQSMTALPDDTNVY